MKYGVRKHDNHVGMSCIMLKPEVLSWNVMYYADTGSLDAIHLFTSVSHIRLCSSHLHDVWHSFHTDCVN